MEPHRQKQQDALQPGAGQKPRRFRIVKLEERIAPASIQPMGKTRICMSNWSPTDCCTWPPGHRYR